MRAKLLPTGAEMERVAFRHIAAVPVVNGAGESAEDWSDGDYRYIRTTDISTLDDLDETKKAGLSPDKGVNAVLQYDDIVMTAAGATIGKAHHWRSSEKACYAGYLVRFRADPRLCEPRFIAWWTQSLDFSQQVAAGAVRSTIDNFSAGKYRALKVPRPSLEVQRTAAEYLDRETTKIDALIEKQRALVAGLRYRRQALRDHLVVQARASAGLRPLKFSARLTVGIVVTPAAWYADSGHVALRGTNIRDERIDTTDVVRLTNEGHYGHTKSILSTGDVVVVRTGQAGTAACVPPNLDGVNAIDVVIVKPDSSLDGDYLAMVLNSSGTRGLMTVGSVGAIQGHFNTGSLSNVDVPVPPLDQQLRLVGLWHEQRDDIDTLIDKSQRLIELSQERRAALITAAVTGQIDVAEMESSEEAA